MNPKPKVPDDIKELIALVRAGKLFTVQKWIAEGKRTMPPRPYRNSPIDIAVEIGFHSMVEVLLEAGVDQEAKDGLLGEAVWRGNFDLIKLFVEHGANIHAVTFEEVCDTVNPEIIRYFLDCGIDAVTGQPFAHALEEPKRPFLGIYLDYKDKIPELKNQLNQALRFHSGEGRLRWVCLLLWAGADQRHVCFVHAIFCV
jgi:hypothetical protein